ncbi:MAG: sigma-70 family RNA polymerase sigma factor [Saprospiraceae bacterium]|nr:sigma-70 family RNA polymerase sigma factor [Saprospiraceae bacterium]
MIISQEICNQFSDKEIILKSLEDIDFFSCLYQRYETKLTFYIHRISKVTDEEAEDILQEVFIKVWKSLHAIDPALKLSSWLYRVVHNEVVSRWRKNKWSRDNPTIAISDDMLQSLADDMELKKPTEEVINQALLKISEKYRKVLVLKYFEELSYEEISDILKMPEGTVATRLNRAKQSLKSEIGKIILV